MTSAIIQTSSVANNPSGLTQETPQIQSLIARIEDLKNQIINAENTPERNERSIGDLKGRVIVLNEELIQNLKNKRTVLAEENARLTNENTRLTQDTTNLSERLIVETGRNAQLEDDNEAELKFIRELQAEIEELKNRK